MFHSSTCQFESLHGPLPNSIEFVIQGAVMALVESVAAFEQRCDELNPTGAIKIGLRNQGVTCFSLLAFAVGSPQVPPTEAELAAFAQTVYGGAPTIGQLANLKRLYFEATTLVIASLKQSVANETSDQQVTLKKLPVAEKRARAEEQAGRLAGLNMTGELEPSHHLVDLANHILETGSIIWIAPSKCSKRDDEIQVAIKERTSSIQIENAVLKVAQTTSEVHGDTGSELKLQWCWQRRGIAFDRCGLISWAVHEKWISTMLNNLSKETPAGFGSIKTEQLIRADRELFTILSQEHHGTVKPQAGVSPLDARVRALMTDPRITMFMLPLPSSHRAVRDDIDKGSKGDSDKPPKPPKKKAKKARAEKSCPDELKKYKMNYTHGRICWGYNLKDGCSLSTQKHDGKPHKCNKGYHVCANCHKPGHSAAACRSADN